MGQGLVRSTSNFSANHPSLIENHAGLHGLPSNVGTLSERVRFSVRRIDDHRSQRLSTLQGHQTIGILRKEEDGVNVSLGTGGRNHRVTSSIRLSTTSIRPALHQSSEEVTHAFNSTDFIFPRRRIAVVLHVLEVRHRADVSFTIGMADSHEAGRDGFSVEARRGLNAIGQETSLLVLQLTRNATLQGQRDRRVHFITSSTVRIFNVGTTEQDTDTHVFNSFRSLFTHDLRNLFHNRGVVGIEQNVGHGHEVTILMHSGFNVGNRESLSSRRNTFGQFLRRGIKRFKATELSGLRALGRQGISLTKLFKHEVGKSTDEHLSNDIDISHRAKSTISRRTGSTSMHDSIRSSH
nr:MAG TPA: hypothetical protein [Caudoviricetes sp.]